MVTTPALLLILAALQVRSPQVHADRTVTFRLRSPNAVKVELSLEGQPGLSLQKQADGVWSVTTKALAPDIYGYSFNVDGVTVLDPDNPETKPNLIWQSNSLTVPGNPPEAWEVQDVPHGQLNRHFYKSKIIGDQRDFYVYTPPGYSAKSAKLPVLYLLHGYSDTANGWSAVGKAHVILDNLIAKGKAKPMLVVMTLGYGVPGFASPGSQSFGNRDLVKQNYAKFAEALLMEVIPMIESDYRVSAKQEHRAIAGLSMGGAESLLIGLNHPTVFGALGAFSSGGFPATNPAEILPNLDVAKANKLSPFFMACGTEDGLIGFQRDFTGWLKGKGIDVKTKETPGGHTWPLWRRNLIEFAGMIFRG